MTSSSRSGTVAGGLALAAVGIAGAAAAQWRRAVVRERDAIELLRRVGRVSSRLPDARAESCEGARRALHADVDLLLVPDGDELVTSAAAGESVPRLEIRADDPGSVAARAFREQDVAFARGGDATELRLLAALGARAVLAVPVTRVGVRVGVNLWAWRRPPRRLPARVRRLAEILADEKGMAIQRHELFVQAIELMRTQVRARLARDLHDSVAQELAVLAMYAESARQARAQDSPVLDEVLALIESHAGKAQAEMRKLLDALRVGRPIVELGIADLVDALVADFRARCRDVAVDVELPGGHGIEVAPAVRETVYFVLREALHNAATHAGASRVRVQTRAQPDSLTLIVEDDGRGFDVAAATGGDRHGLVGMRERARLAGGRLDVRSAPDGGTTVELRIEQPRFHRPPR